MLGVALLCTLFAAAPAARAQDFRQAGATSEAGTINLGGRAWSLPEGRHPAAAGGANQLEFEFRGGLASDYIYRGVTLSDRKPAIGAAFGLTYGLLYAGTTVASVKLPTQPAAEISFGGGIRPKIGVIDLDIGVTYFAYPGENPALKTNGINYWEAAIRAETKLTDSFRIGGGIAYSPNVSNTGAWSWYAAFGAAYDVPSHLLPADIAISLSSAAGYSWFGHQSAELGGFALPAYLNWNAGATFSRKMINLDLRYHDTNLSKENCFVFTGDPNAQPGGQPNPLTNPDGLTSRWCGAAFVAKLWFALN